ncbi:MAG: PQQ-dependent sugar dehydrogenase [Hyphomonas sp.]
MSSTGPAHDVWRAMAAASLIILPACGGGGGSGSPPPPPPPPPANRPPVVASAATAAIDENVSGPVYTFAATDPDGDPVTYALVSGGDSGVFSFAASTGVLSLAAGLDFEDPDDADNNNVYAVTFTATDNRGGSTSFPVSITVRDVAEGTSLSLRRVGSGFSQPLYLTGIPGTDTVVVLEKGGRARVLNPDTGAVESVPFLDLTGPPSQVSTDGERGLLGIAFSPDFIGDRTLYVNITNVDGDTEIRRYRMMTGSNTQVDPSTGDVILTIAQPESNHNGGWLGFANSGRLYVPTGDGGGGGDPNDFAQNPNSLLGKILRIDVESDGFPSDPDRDYAIPPGNAFPNAADGAPEIFALGVRNPFRASVDPVSGDLIMGDVGQGAIEEINRMRPGDSGANFGWNVREGTQSFTGPDSPAFTAPVAEYARGSGPTQGNSVTGGYIYRGPIAALNNRYIFGDFISGNVWSVPESSLVIGQTLPASQFTRLNDQLVPDAGTLNNIASFGLDNEGRPYIVSLNGSVFRIESAP